MNTPALRAFYRRRGLCGPWVRDRGAGRCLELHFSDGRPCHNAAVAVMKVAYLAIDDLRRMAEP